MENMDKNEIYEALKNDGAKLKAVNFYTVEQLQDIYQDRFEHIPTENNDSPAIDNPADPIYEEIRTLVFDRGGWCNELNTSYAPGIYRPATVEEFQVLKKYAKEIL